MTIRVKIQGPANAATVATWRMACAPAKIPNTVADILAENVADVSMAADAKWLGAVALLNAQVTESNKDPVAAAAQMQAALTSILGAAKTPAEAVEMTLTEANKLWAAAGGDNRQTQGHVSQGHSWDSPASVAMKAADALAAQLGARMGLDIKPTMGREMVSMSLGDMAMVCARAAGHRPVNSAEAITMFGFHTGSDFPYAIQNGLSATVARGFDVAQPAIAQAAYKDTAVDYRARNSVGLSGSGQPELVRDGGEVPYTTIDEKGEAAPKLEDFAAMFSIGRQSLVNDSTALNLLTDIAVKMRIGAISRFRAELLAPLLANAGAGQTMKDGNPLFHASHRNLAGTGAAISVASLTIGRTAMRRQKDSQGNILAIEPALLVVAPEKETEAQQIVKTINATKSSDTNPFADGLKVIVEPGLTSPNAWYLAGDPNLARGLVYAWLDGMMGPKVETQPGWTRLGMEFRLTMAVGAAFVETASWFRNPGA